ncbi:carboxyvinyl-carboxyphosphonate phosphorylmutase [Pseudoalteromonas sp. NBT06-2]|uniref:isocitrate lyase/PEP mutase family protein n=1 Tax=Pseudoalteromonas sp. NBT06-2 TaxID=2025950 RepID=UPI000BA59A7F|nr:isocitrate lyase/phosphoenolpyruvate mutase family protein [Pseudoalteromonas sp. NBT06-2]PAJ72901.1 carboxyvinyl-carboxyphosphonate phosphorylmutase [Pseudoalteromonas sp. NBT06-2]
MNFKQLHYQQIPLLICNVWDANGAKLAQKQNFQAIGTSSAAIANMLGYEDGEQMDFDELVYIVKRILASTTLPLTVDIESGYSRDPFVTAGYIKRLADLGVVGINIEDSIVTTTRELLNAESFSLYLKNISSELTKLKVEIFINARTDTFLLGHENALSETKKRITLFEKAGVNGIFVPCIKNINDIKEVVNSTKLPINVMCMPDLPDFNELNILNVKRISMGNFLFDNLADTFTDRLTSILKSQSFTPIF